MNEESKTKAAYSIGEAARLVPCSPSTLIRWETMGQITPLRVGNGCRIYTAADIERLRSLKGKRI